MKKTFCDIPKCKGEAWHEVDCCVGWLQRSDSEIYKPFQKADIRKHDLCDKHYRMWCEATYKAFFEMPEDMVKKHAG